MKLITTTKHFKNHKDSISTTIMYLWLSHSTKMHATLNTMWWITTNVASLATQYSSHQSHTKEGLYAYMYVHETYCKQLWRYKILTITYVLSYYRADWYNSTCISVLYTLSKSLKQIISNTIMYMSHSINCDYILKMNMNITIKLNVISDLIN